MPSPAVLVACLCAEWCNTCTDYRAPFLQLQQEFPQADFVWVDIEDEADLIDPIEVDNFPTLLIASAGEPQFFGTVTPHMDTLRRLVQNHQSAGKSQLPHMDDLRKLVLQLSK
jgi:thioredoxin 1